MPEFSFHLPGRLVTGECETVDATDQQIVAAFAADFAEGERVPEVVYQVDSFVRLSYSVEYHEPQPDKPAKGKAGAKNKSK